MVECRSAELSLQGWHTSSHDFIHQQQIACNHGAAKNNWLEIGYYFLSLAIPWVDDLLLDDIIIKDASISGDHCLSRGQIQADGQAWVPGLFCEFHHTVLRVKASILCYNKNINYLLSNLRQILLNIYLKLWEWREEPQHRLARQASSCQRQCPWRSWVPC